MGFIFESEIEAIIHTVRSHTIGEDESITLRRILMSDIHPAIKAYFKAEVEKTLSQERTLELRSKKFPYSHPEIMSLQQQTDLLLMHHYQFNQHEFDSLLDESVHFQFNYLCRPQWTLMNFVFGGQRKVSTNEIEKKLAYCVDYTYFGILIRRYLIDRGLTEMTYEEFRSILQKIDLEVVARHSSAELARMMRAMFTFVDAGRLTPHDRFDQPTIPVNAAVVFFEDKELTDLKERLELERDTNKLTHITLNELANIIERVRSGDEHAMAPGMYHTPGLVSEVEPTDGNGERSSPPPELVPAAEDQGAEKSDGHEKPPVESENTASTTAARKVAFVDLRTLLSNPDRKLFLKKIFSKDEVKLEEAIDQINEFPTWTEATHYLDSLFVAQGVDPFSPVAVQFTERVYARFHPQVPL